ncbi:MAG: hypothetical protein ACOY46_18840 [Bacillota bacterium]
MLKREMYVRMHLSAVEDGLIGVLGGDRWANALHHWLPTWTRLGSAFRPNKKIAEYLKLSRQAVNKRIKDLLEFRFHGKPVLTLVATGEGVNRRVNRYRIEPVAQLAIFGSGVEAIEEARLGGLSSQPDTNYNHRTKTNEPEIPPGEKESEPVHNNIFKILLYMSTAKFYIVEEHVITMTIKLTGTI